MSIPFATTTVTIERPANVLQDSRTEPTWTVVATKVPCVLGSLSGSENGRSQVTKTGGGRFDQDVDVRPYDRLTDDVTGDVFEAGAVQVRRGFGLDHKTVQLKRFEGATGG